MVRSKWADRGCARLTIVTLVYCQSTILARPHVTPADRRFGIRTRVHELEAKPDETPRFVTALFAAPGSRSTRSWYYTTEIHALPRFCLFSIFFILLFLSFFIINSVVAGSAVSRDALASSLTNKKGKVHSRSASNSAATTKTACFILCHDAESRFIKRFPNTGDLFSQFARLPFLAILFIPRRGSCHAQLRVDINNWESLNFIGLGGV